MRKILALAATLLITGCTSTLPYRSLGEWSDAVETLGEVNYCQGGGCSGSDEGSQWPLALTSAPTQDNIHAALIAKAIKVYHVPEQEIVLKEINVKLLTEVVGTVRGWKATAVAGRKAKRI
jgi:hypothetical protein